MVTIVFYGKNIWILLLVAKKPTPNPCQNPSSHPHEGVEKTDSFS